MKNDANSTPILRRTALNFTAIVAVSAIFGAKAFETAHDAQMAAPHPADTINIDLADAGTIAPVRYNRPITD